MLEQREWLTFAESDLTAAKVLLSSNEAVIGQIMFHAQQGAEKSLMAFLVSKESYLKKQIIFQVFCLNALILITSFLAFCLLQQSSLLIQ